MLSHLDLCIHGNAQWLLGIDQYQLSRGLKSAIADLPGPDLPWARIHTEFTSNGSTPSAVSIDGALHAEKYPGQVALTAISACAAQFLNQALPDRAVTVQCHIGYVKQHAN